MLAGIDLPANPATARQPGHSPYPDHQMERNGGCDHRHRAVRGHRPRVPGPGNPSQYFAGLGKAFRSRSTIPASFCDPSARFASSGGSGTRMATASAPVALRLDNRSSIERPFQDIADLALAERRTNSLPHRQQPAMALQHRPGRFSALYHVSPRSTRIPTRMHAALQAGGIPTATPRPVLHIPDHHRARARQIAVAHGLKPGRYAIFLPGCNANGFLKRWPLASGCWRIDSTGRDWIESR